MELESKKKVAQPAPKRSLQNITLSTLYRKGEFEIRLFNNLYTQNQFFDTDRKAQDTDKSTYLTVFIQSLVGVHPRVNVGFDLQLRSVLVDPNRTSSAAQVYKLSNIGMAQTKLASLGPKIKFLPFRKVPILSIQSTLFIPVVKNLEGGNIGRPFLDYDKFLWWNQVFYDLRINQYLNLFFGQDFSYRFAGSSELPNVVQLPTTFIINVFPVKWLTVYALSQFYPTTGNGFYSSWFMQLGGGIKLLPTNSLEIELGYNNFVAGLSTGKGQVYNLGIRYVY